MDDCCVDPKIAIDWLQKTIREANKAHTIKYKIYSGTRFYYIEPLEI